MKISRLVSSMFVAVAALGLTVASSAFAEPEFKPTGGTVEWSSLGTNTLTAGGNTLTCTKNTAGGTIASLTLANNIVVTFTGCTSSGSGGSGCSASSEGAASGTVVTLTLHGVLGLILPKGTGTGVGLLLLPVANKKIVVVEGNTCTVSTTVTGNLAGEASPIGKSQTTAKLVFAAATTGGESIKDFDLSTVGLLHPELEAWGALASEASTDDLSFSAALEIT